MAPRSYSAASRAGWAEAGVETLVFDWVCGSAVKHPNVAV